MEEVVEKRKWLFTRRKSSKEGNSRLRRRPTLSNFLAECEKQRRRDSGPPISHFSQNIKQQEDLMSTSLNDPNFRLQQKYWGKIHRRTPTPSPSPEFENSSDDEDYDDENNISSRNSEEENEEEEEEEEHSFDNESNKINYFNKKREENKNKFEQQINSEKFIRNRRTEYLKQQERERPFSDGALIPEQEILMKISVTDAHRPKRDERGRRLGGEWDKRLERLGNQLIAKLNEKGGGEGGGKEEEFNLKKKKEDEEEEEEEYKNEHQSLPSCSSTAISPTTKKTFSQSTKSRSRKSSKSRKSNKNYSHRGSSKRKRRKGERHFSEPNLGTLERFEKVRKGGKGEFNN